MTDEQNEQPQVPKLGERLRAAREQKGLTVESAAERLNLKVGIIKGIEAEEFEQRVSATFTRGYVKQYAKLLDVPESEALAALDDLNAAKPEPTKLHSFSRKVSRQASDDRLMMISYVILAVIIGLVVVWWLQQPSSDKTIGNVLPDTLLSENTSDNDANDNQSSSSWQTSDPAASSTPDRQESVADEADKISPRPVAIERTEGTTTQSEPVSSGATRESATESASEESTDTQVSTESDSDESMNPTPTEPQAETALDTTASIQTQASDDEGVSETSVAIEGQAEAVFEFSDDCWVNIVDSTGEAVAYGIKKAGRVMPVTGVPPFEVTLGAPEAVAELTFDGQTVDMSSFREGRTARFTLPME